jgi:hypothetical protein
MSTTPTAILYTPEDLLSMADGHCYDLVNGQLVERPMDAESSRIAQLINQRIGLFADSHQCGLVWGPDCGYQISADDPNKVRYPDGSSTIGCTGEDREVLGVIMQAPTPQNALCTASRTPTEIAPVLFCSRSSVFHIVRLSHAKLWLPTYCSRAHPIKRAFGDGHDKCTRTTNLPPGPPHR